MVDAVGTTHHVKIGDQLHLIRQGSYRKQGAPQFGARFATGDADYSHLNLWQYWAQMCWVGGFGSEKWSDDSMYDEVSGVDTQQHDVMVLSRDLTWSHALEGATAIRQFIVFNNKLYCLSFGAGIVSTLWSNSGLGWGLVHTFNDECRSMEVFLGKLWIGDYGSTFISMTTAEVFGSIARPAGAGTEIPYAMKAFRSHLYVAFGRKIFRLTDEEQWDGSTVFYHAAGMNYIDSMEVHLGFLWMASNDGHVLRTDGANTFDMWAFDPGLVIRSIRSFDGRLFLSVEEPIAGTSAVQAVLYQLSGASVTELKRWGVSGMDVSTGELRVIGSRLYFGAPSLLGMDDGFGVACYDPREDAYHMFATNKDYVTYPGGTEGRGWLVDDVIYFKGRIYASVRGFGIADTKLTFRDVTRFQATYDTTATGATVAPFNGGWITSSDFDAGTPGLLKYWDAIIIEVDLPTADCSVVVEVSGNGGVGWAEIGSVLKTDALLTRYSKALPLLVGGLPLSRSRLKWRLTLRTADTTRSPQVRGVTVRYLPIPEPNWRWDMTLVLSREQKNLDDSINDTVDVAAKLAALELAFRQQLPVHFTDIDGVEWGASGARLALITDLREDVRFVGPSTDGVIEREVAVTLVEVKDGYELAS